MSAYIYIYMKVYLVCMRFLILKHFTNKILKFQQICFAKNGLSGNRI